MRQTAMQQNRKRMTGRRATIHPQHIPATMPPNDAKEIAA